MNGETGSEWHNEKKPLVTFALIAYNQEKYIREAVEAALSQTYSPLEIILSDDCSADRTFEVMRELAECYTGQHKLLLNHNKINQGIGQHINRVMEIAQGELIVIAAGDDISVPERVDVIVAAWLASNKMSLSLHSGFTEIDEEGQVISVRQNRNALNFDNIAECVAKNIGVTGATHAWAKINFEKFGPLRNDLTHEDCAIPLRAMLLGRVEYIDIPLVKYRNAGISNGAFSDIDDELYGRGAVFAERYYIDYLQKMQDLTKFGADKILMRICSKQLQKHKLIKSLAKKEAPKIKLLVQAILNGVSIWYATTRALKYVLPNLIAPQRYAVSKVRQMVQLCKRKLLK